MFLREYVDQIDWSGEIDKNLNLESGVYSDVVRSTLVSEYNGFQFSQHVVVRDDASLDPSDVSKRIYSFRFERGAASANTFSPRTRLLAIMEFPPGGTDFLTDPDAWAIIDLSNHDVVSHGLGFVNYPGGNRGLPNSHKDLFHSKNPNNFEPDAIYFYYLILQKKFVDSPEFAEMVHDATIKILQNNLAVFLDSGRSDNDRYNAYYASEALIDRLHYIFAAGSDFYFKENRNGDSVNSILEGFGTSYQEVRETIKNRCTQQFGADIADFIDNLGNYEDKNILDRFFTFAADVIPATIKSQSQRRYHTSPDAPAAQAGF
jgi:hypothetical protein